MSTVIELKAEREKLFFKYKERYVLKNNDEIIKALSEAGFKDFKLADILEYEKVLTKYFDEREDKLLELYERGVQATPCPIIGCPGYKKYDKDNLRWECSVSGYSHYMAMRVAELRASITGNADNIREDATSSLKTKDKADG